MTSEEEAAAEIKRKRLEAWRKRLQEQQQRSSVAPESSADSSSKPLSEARNENPTLKLGPSFSLKVNTKKSAKRNIGALKLNEPASIWGSDDEVDVQPGKKKLGIFNDGLINPNISSKISERDSKDAPPKQKRNRWDSTPAEEIDPSRNVLDGPVSMNAPPSVQATPMISEVDALDQFMDHLTAGAMGSVAIQDSSLSIDVGGSMIGETRQKLHSGGTITFDDLTQVKQGSTNSRKTDPNAVYGPSDWESETAGTDDEEEEQARREFIETLKKSSIPSMESPIIDTTPQLASEVQSEKHRREEHLHMLQRQAEDAVKAAEAVSQPSIGRLYNDIDDGIMEEAERTLNALNAAPDALQVLAEINKKKELKAVDHSSIEYLPIRKNLFIIPRALAELNSEEVALRRDLMGLKVRGPHAPPPVSSFNECGLSEIILAALTKQNIVTPFPVQAQCMPCIMAGRDVIGIAKTGSGKTLAYLLPMLRHICDQPPLGSYETGPIGLVLCPARELAVQIHHVAKGFANILGLKSTAVYGGSGVKEQIGDLKRGAHIVVCTPGRMIDILTMQSGKILSLQRVSFVVLDEADRMFDMGFSPQITAILSAVRPDRQTVLFSATFPKAVETLARKSLKYPIEVIVGGRSVASDSVTQYAEVVEDEEKFLRMLQLLGEYADDSHKVIVFVDTQARADSIFEQLMRCGYPALSLHGGKEQEDRDSTIADFRDPEGPNILVATSVAGRGLDVPSCICVINYSAPNHIEDYVHRVGRTGRAGKKGFSYTFVSSTDEAKFAPIVVRALVQAGQEKNIRPDLLKLSEEFTEKVKRGEARYAGSGFKGKGFSYDASELSEAQKLARLEKRQALIDAGMIDADEDDSNALVEDDLEESGVNIGDSEKVENVNTKDPLATIASLQSNLSAEIMALPGMKEAILRKAGVEPSSTSALSSSFSSLGSNHFMEEIEINDYPREARWKVTQNSTAARLQDEFQTAMTLKGKYFAPNTQPADGERRLYLHLEASSVRTLQTAIQEVRRLLNEETLKVASRAPGSSHRYNVLG